MYDRNEPNQNGPAGEVPPDDASLHTSPGDPPDEAKKEATSKSLAASLGFASWPYSDDALINALRVKAEHERTKQEFFRFESNKRVLEILEIANRFGIPGHAIPALFSGNDEIAKRVLSQFSGASGHAEKQGQERQAQLPGQPLPALSTAAFAAKSPRTPVRPSGPGQSPSTQPTLGPVHEFTSRSTPSVPTQIMEPKSQPSAQHRHSLSFDSSRDSPDRFIPGHMSSVSALPAFGPLSPSVFPAGSPQGRPVVPGGFYPTHLVSPRLPQLHQPPQTTSPRQPAQAMGLQIPSLTMPVAGSSQFSGPVPVPMVQPQSPSQYAQQSQGQPPPPQQLNVQPGQVHLAGQARLSASPSQSPVNYTMASQPPRPQQATTPSHPQPHHQPASSSQQPDRSTSNQSRPLIPVLNTTGPRPSGRRGGHRHSLSTGADLQIHQWKPKQLLRDNRWKISNPFSKLKERKADDHQAADKSGDRLRPAKAAAEKPGPEPRPSENVDAAKPSDPGYQDEGLLEAGSSRVSSIEGTAPAAKRLSAGFRSPPPPASSAPASSAAVVAAHNNKRRSMTHARQKSRSSAIGGDAAPYASGDDATRHSEGVAVLASLATEQDRRDREDNDASRGQADSGASQPPASQ